MYRFIAGHVDVSGDRLVAYGDLIENPDQRLIDREFVIPVEGAGETEVSRPTETAPKQVAPPEPFEVKDADAPRN